MKTVAIIAGGGGGLRFGGKRPKQFLTLNGDPLIIHTLRAFERAKRIAATVVVLPGAELDFLTPDECKQYQLEKVANVVEGGRRRQDSVRLGLEAVPEGTEFVAIHDAARCCITAEEIDHTVEACKEWDGAVSAIRIRDTVKKVDDISIQSTIPREDLWAMHTPQVFRFDFIRSAYREAERVGFDATDDGMMAEKFGGRVRVVEGRFDNFKVTRPEDMQLAEKILESRA